MHILHVFTGSFIDLVSKCFESSLRVKIICIRTQSLYFRREKLLQSQFKVISELADQVFFLLLISCELRVASKSVKGPYTREMFTVSKTWRWWFSWLSMIKNMAAAMFLIILSQENHHRQVFDTVNISRVYGPLTDLLATLNSQDINNKKKTWSASSEMTLNWLCNNFSLRKYKLWVRIQIIFTLRLDSKHFDTRSIKEPVKTWSICKIDYGN